MAKNIDLMKTQTGGEGDTVQIQTQEQITPEQFDVNITSQVQEPPVEPPVQKVMTEPEFQPTQPSVFEEQQVFQENPPIPADLQQEAPSQIVTKQESLDIPIPVLDIPPFGYESYAKYKEGTLHSGKGGKVVKSRDQAVAIAMSEGRKASKGKK